MELILVLGKYTGQEEIAFVTALDYLSLILVDNPSHTPISPIVSFHNAYRENRVGLGIIEESVSVLMESADRVVVVSQPGMTLAEVMETSPGLTREMEECRDSSLPVYYGVENYLHGIQEDLNILFSDELESYEDNQDLAYEQAREGGLLN